MRENPELDITTFLNLMVILIPFLLISAVFFAGHDPGVERTDRSRRSGNGQAEFHHRGGGA